MPIFENFPSKEPVVTKTKDGLMSKEDKNKLDSIEEGANNYVHPDDENTRHITDDERELWTLNTLYTNDMATVNALGGIPAGTTFDNMPISELLTKLLYPYIAPVVSASSSPNGGTYEKGVPISVTQITVNVTKKSEAITKVEVFDGSTSLGVRTDGQVGSLAFPVDITVTANKTFTAKVTDASGKTVSANTGSFNFVYPYYYGVLADGTTLNGNVVKSLSKQVQSKGNKAIDFTANNQKMVIAYPKSYGILAKIVDPNQFDVTATWASQEVSLTMEDGTSAVYYVYTSKLVTVDNYTMKFNY